jgi:SAM-dependent methyltransferase
MDGGHRFGSSACTPTLPPRQPIEHHVASFSRYLADVLPTPPAPGRGLNVGCGDDLRTGYVNQDMAALPGVDMVCELGEEKLPVEDGAFDVILARDVLEHVDLIPALRELHRVLAPGGRLIISTVHFTSRNLW